MEDRGSITQNHYDHVHSERKAWEPGGGRPTQPNRIARDGRVPVGARPPRVGVRGG